MLKTESSVEEVVNVNLLPKPQSERTPWSDDEIEASVVAYLDMMRHEDTHEAYSKSDVNEQLRRGELEGRTKSSVEFRMQNISAVFQKAGQEWLSGYAPAQNVGVNVRVRIEKFLRLHGALTSSPSSEGALDRVTAEDIRTAIEMFENGVQHRFGDSTKYDISFNGRSFPPKAIIGLAVLAGQGIVIGPEAFKGGLGSKCFRILGREGFAVVPKASDFASTTDSDILRARTLEALQSPVLPRPAGRAVPARKLTEATVFERDPLVRAYVLRRSNGICECCGSKAPFVDEDGFPFLEVHHVQSLAEDGSDVVGNAVAICPNCHRECHHGKCKADLKRKLLLLLESDCGN